MKPIAYIILYLLSNLLRTFSLYLYMESALQPSKRRFRLLYYFVFYVFVSLIYLIFDIPILTLTANVIGLLSLTLLYPSDFKQRIVSFIFIYSISIFSEAIILIPTSYIGFSFTDRGYYESLFGIICTPLILFIFVTIYRRRKKKAYNTIYIPFSYTVSILSIPLSFIIITLFIFSFVSLSDWQIAVIVTPLFLITIGSYLLYEYNIAFLSQQNDINLLNAQNSYYKKQLELITDNNERIKRFRHDIENHLVTLSSITASSNNNKAHEYINNLRTNLFNSSYVVDTGNPVIDGLINVKYSLALENQTPINLTIQIPSNCPIDDVDATILLGNLLDNAIENAIGDISLIIKYNNNRLFISCSNQFSGNRRKIGDYFATTKDDSSIHGYGYKNMLRITKKYNGTIDSNASDGYFKVRIILYLNQENDNFA